MDDDGTTDKRMLAHTDTFHRRCSRCRTTGHVAQFCRAGHRAAGAHEVLWSILRIPADLLPPTESATAATKAVSAPVANSTLQQALPPRDDHPLVKSALQFLAGKHQPKLQQQWTAGIADRRQVVLVSSTPSSCPPLTRRGWLNLLQLAPSLLSTYTLWVLRRPLSSPAFGLTWTPPLPLSSLEISTLSRSPYTTPLTLPDPAALH